MKYRLKIRGVLPGANEYINAERTNKYKAAEMKRQAEHAVICAARQQLRGVRITKPVYMAYTWTEPNRRRDKDNIAFAKKFIQDALVKAKILKNDGWGEITGFDDTFCVDKNSPHITVEIYEVEEADHAKRKI